MNPDQQAVQKILELASSWAESGHTGLQRTLGLLNVGRIGVEEAVKKAGRDLTVLAEAGADLRAKGLKAEETVRRVNNIAAIRAQKELTNKIITSKPVSGLAGRRMAVTALAGLGGAASGVTLANLLNQPEEKT